MARPRNHNNSILRRFPSLLAATTCAMLVCGSALAMQDNQPPKQPPQPGGVNKAQPKQLPTRQPRSGPAGVGQGMPNLPLPAHNPDDEVDLGDGLIIVDMVPGEGREVTPGSLILAEYSGWLLDSGEMFDSSRRRGAAPLATPIPGQVVDGWNRGIPGMKIGGRRKLIIPAALAFGEKQVGSIPPNSDLVFVVDLLEVAPPFQAAGEIVPSASDSRYVDVVVGEGTEFAKGGFGNFHLTLWNQDGRYVGSTRRGSSSTASADAEMFWVQFAHGMKEGGQRMVEFPDPSPGPPPETDEDGNVIPTEPRLWHMLIRAEDLAEPRFPTAHDPIDEIGMGDGLILVHLKVGDGEMIPKHYIPTIHYDSWVKETERLFDSTRRPGRTPISYSIGLYPDVWKVALDEMRVGGIAKLIVPGDMAYGEAGAPNYGIGPNEDLIYEIELLSFEEPLFLPLDGGEDFEDFFGGEGGGGFEDDHEDHDH